MTTRWFAACSKRLEEPLQDELRALGARDTEPTVAGVAFHGPLELAYRACLESRFASRVLLPLVEFPLDDTEAIYQAARTVDWLAHVAAESRFVVEVAGQARAVQHTHYAAQRVKDAVVDVVRERTGVRPSVDLEAPDWRLRLSLLGPRAVLALDLSGTPLHERGYRVGPVAAPLKETLAAALLWRAGWPEWASSGAALIDPCCGSGTLLIEAVWMAAGVAPGLLRRRFGFEHWHGHDPRLWAEVRRGAEERARAGLAALQNPILGRDRDTSALERATRNLQAAGVGRWVRLERADVEHAPAPKLAERALVITNPPYGERLGSVREALPLYRALGRTYAGVYRPGRLAVFSPAPELLREVGLRVERRYSLYNGELECTLALYDLASELRAPGQSVAPEAEALANRIEKNLRRLKSYLVNEQVRCFRAYDADLPEYAVAIDVYGDRLHVQEYAAPSSIDPALAERRLDTVLKVVRKVFAAPSERIYLKTRRRQRGRAQYGRQGEQGQEFEVVEGGLRFGVNLEQYTDTGLFLDTRIVRRWIRQQAAGKRFLNLFCYTASATVYAAAGGARSSLSIDLSPTYLDWAGRNFARNRLDPRAHRLLRADVVPWLAMCKERFDLIYLDPPTFSNSKRTPTVFDVQRDHAGLIHAAMACLAPGGVLYFVCNARRFKLAAELSQTFKVQDLTAASLPPDFVGDPPIHHCFRIGSS